MKKTIVSIVAVAILFCSCSTTTEKKIEIPVIKIKEEIEVIPDSNLTVTLFPVRVMAVVEGSEGYSFFVECENGYCFNTNKKYKVNDIAIYMDGDSEKIYTINE